MGGTVTRRRRPHALDPWRPVLEAAVASDEGRVPRSARVIAEQVGVTGVAPSTVAEYIRRLQRAQRQRVSGAAESSVVVVPDFTLGGDAFLQVRVPR